MLEKHLLFKPTTHSLFEPATTDIEKRQQQILQHIMERQETELQISFC